MNQGQELRPDSHQDQSKEEELNIAAAETVSVLNNAPSSKGIRISSRFEPIVWNDLITLCAAFAVSAAIGIVVPKFGLKDLTLFYSRTVVALIGTFIGLVCSYSLYRIGRHWFDSSVWATLIENASHSAILDETFTGKEHPLTLAMLDNWLNDVGPIAGLQILLYRTFGRRGGMRRSFFSLWGLCSLFFPLGIYWGALQAFIYGRTVTLVPFVQQQNHSYYSIPVIGTLTLEDVSRASLVWESVQDPRRVWTYQSLADPLSPKSKKLASPENKQPVYFTDAYPALLDNSGVGYGAFNLTKLAASAAFSSASLVENDIWSASSRPPIESSNLASVIYFPRWGERVHCRLLSDLFDSFIERSSNDRTFIFIPREFLQEIFDDIDVEMPAIFNGNVDYETELIDELPSNVNLASIAIISKFEYDEVALSTSSVIVDPDVQVNRMVTIDTILIRLNQTFTPNGTFAHSGSDGLGYDGAVCVSVMEPYVVSTFNSSTGLQTLAIISSGVELPKFGKRVGERVSHISTINVSTVALTHHAAGTNAKLEIRKSNARDSSWMPNPTLISITSGEIDPGLTTGDRYGKLDRIKLEDTIGLVDSRFTLPYFAGSASIEGYNFYGVEKAYAHVLIGWLLGSLGLVLVIGLIGSIFRPILPLGLSHRETSLSAFQPLLQRLPSDPQSADLAAALASATTRGNSSNVEVLSKFEDLRSRTSRVSK